MKPERGGAFLGGEKVPATAEERDVRILREKESVYWRENLKKKRTSLLSMEEKRKNPGKGTPQQEEKRGKRDPAWPGSPTHSSRVKGGECLPGKKGGITCKKRKKHRGRQVESRTGRYGKISS